MGTTTRWTRLIALSMTVFALAVPAVASASPVPALGTYHATEQDSDFVAATPRVSRTDSGFDWGDAALGGVAVLAIGIVGAGALVMVRTYHRHGHAQVHPS